MTADPSEPHEIRLANAAKIEPKRAFLLLGAVLIGLTIPVIALALVTGLLPLLTLLIHTGVFGGMALGYGARSTKGATATPGELCVDANRIAFNGKTLATRAEVSQGFVMPTDEGTLVRFERRALALPVVLRVPDEATANAILAKLGFDARHTAAHMHIASGVLALPVASQAATFMGPVLLLLPAIALAIALTGPGAGPYVFSLVALFLAYTFGVALAPTSVRIGTDGIVTSWLFSKRFVPYSTVSRAETYKRDTGGKVHRGVLLALRDGTEVNLPTGQSDVGDVEAARLLARVDQSRAAYAEGSPRAHTEVLGRGGRSVREWVRELRRIGAGAYDHRSSAVPTEALLRVVEDSAASAEERASAAIAAASSGDAEAPGRIRVAAEATASPKLRVALETIARGTVEDEDTALEEALSALEREQAKL